MRGPRQIDDAARWAPTPPRSLRNRTVLASVVLVGFLVAARWGWTAGLATLLAGSWLQARFTPEPVDPDLPACTTAAETGSNTRRGFAWWAAAAWLVLLLAYLAVGVRHTIVHPPHRFWDTQPGGDEESGASTVVWAVLVSWGSWRLWRHLRPSA